MKTIVGTVAFASAFSLISTIVCADPIVVIDPKVKILQDEKALIDAQAARDAAEAAALRAETELKKARAAAASADADIQRAQTAADAKALLDAQTASDTATALALKAASDLAKARATAENVTSEIQKTQLDAAAALTKSQVGAQTAQIDALKTTFGAPPAIGSDGNISISDAGTSMLLQTKAGSLAITWNLAEELCKQLSNSGISEAYFASADLDSKIQNSRLLLRDLPPLLTNVRDPKNRALVGLVTGVKSQVAPAAMLSAVSLIQYGAGALQALSKLTRSDYAVSLSSESTRAAWLEYFMGAKCPKVIPIVQLESVVRNRPLETIFSEIRELQTFYDAYLNYKTGIQKQMDQNTAKIVAAKAAKTDPTPFEDQLTSQKSLMDALVPIEAWLSRILALTNQISTAPAAFLDALTFFAYGENSTGLKIGTRPRLNVVFTTQDGQVTKSFWLSSKKMYGRSAGELIYRVVNADGTMLAAGYLTGLVTTDKVEFDSTAKYESGGTHIWNKSLVSPLAPADTPVSN